MSSSESEAEKSSEKEVNEDPIDDISIENDDPTEREIDFPEQDKQTRQQLHHAKKTTEIFDINRARAAASVWVSPTKSVTRCAPSHLYSASGRTFTEHARIETETVKQTQKKLMSVDVNKPAVKNRSRRVIFMRHGEQMDRAFPGWFEISNAKTKYQNYDLNQPIRLLDSKMAAARVRVFRNNCPLTEMGAATSQLVGRGFNRCEVFPTTIISSPSFACSQTAHWLAKSMEPARISVKIEPGLFDFMGWYDKMPEFFEPLELVSNFGFWVDADYQPVTTVAQMRAIGTCESLPGYSFRLCRVMHETIRRHLREIGHTLLIVGHSTTIDYCARWLLKLQTKIHTQNELSLVGAHYPFCCTVALDDAGDGVNWRLADCPLPPLTMAECSSAVDVNFTLRKTPPIEQPMPRFCWFL